MSVDDLPFEEEEWAPLGLYRHEGENSDWFPEDEDPAELGYFYLPGETTLRSRSSVDDDDLTDFDSFLS